MRKLKSWARRVPGERCRGGVGQTKREGGSVEKCAPDVLSSKQPLGRLRHIRHIWESATCALQNGITAATRALQQPQLGSLLPAPAYPWSWSWHRDRCLPNWLENWATKLLGNSIESNDASSDSNNSAHSDGGWVKAEACMGKGSEQGRIASEKCTLTELTRREKIKEISKRCCTVDRNS